MPPSRCLYPVESLHSRRDTSCVITCFASGFLSKVSAQILLTQFPLQLTIRTSQYLAVITLFYHAISPIDTYCMPAKYHCTIVLASYGALWHAKEPCASGDADIPRGHPLPQSGDSNHRLSHFDELFAPYTVTCPRQMLPRRSHLSVGPLLLTEFGRAKERE
jgi:hypothetical protein